MSCWRKTLLMAALLAAGCGQPADERSAVIAGKVTLGGAPLDAGTVLFMSDDGHAASESLTSGGVYAVRCQPGRYKVAVTPPLPPDPLARPPGPTPPPSGKPIPKRYQELGTSGLAVEAKPGNNAFDISLMP